MHTKAKSVPFFLSHGVEYLCTCFVGPPGEIGWTGVRGATGATGEKGAAGATGAVGIVGLPGPLDSAI